MFILLNLIKRIKIRLIFPIEFWVTQTGNNMHHYFRYMVYDNEAHTQNFWLDRVKL